MYSSVDGASDTIYSPYRMPSVLPPYFCHLSLQPRITLVKPMAQEISVSDYGRSALALTRSALACPVKIVRI